MTKLVLLLSATLFGPAYAGVIYNEMLSGDLSNSGLAPTILFVGLGSNQIFGTTGNVGGTDRDYFTFSVPVGQQLAGITVLPGTASGGTVSFIGLQLGTQVTLPTNTATAAGLLGWWHYSSADINTNILPEMAVPANGSSGFAPPLSAGSYAFWVQDFSPGTFAYGFDFSVTAVPEPSSYATVLSALGMLILVRARYRRK
jgi:hypothetical protein